MSAVDSAHECMRQAAVWRERAKGDWGGALKIAEELEIAALYALMDAYPGEARPL